MEHQQQHFSWDCAHPRPWRIFSSTTVQTLSLLRRVTKSDASRMISGAVSTANRPRTLTIIKKYSSTYSHKGVMSAADCVMSAADCAVLLLCKI